jgi:hypothetical protein
MLELHHERRALSRVAQRRRRRYGVSTAGDAQRHLAVFCARTGC